MRLHSARAACVAAALMGTAAIASPAFAAGTLAGTDIENTATASYETPGGGTIVVDSNKVIIKVDELLDVTVTSSDPGDVATSPGNTGNVQSFQVTNTGNGEEAFTLTPDVAVAGDDFDPALQQLVIDTNGNGVYDPGVDTVYVAGSNDPLLAPDDSVTIFIITDTPATTSDGERAEVSLGAAANTGTGAPGTTFAGQGDGGGDAVVGTTGADAEDSGFLAIQAAILALVKSATVADPFGGSSAVPGSIITYTLIATVTGSGSLTSVVISDPIPADTQYVAESITLEGSAKTDAADADEGNFNGSQIRAALGTLASGETRTITFKVTIQ